MRNLPNKITTALAMELKKATTIDEMQSVVNIYLHGNRTGLPRGMSGPMICLAATEEANKTEEPRKDNHPTNKPSEPRPEDDNSLNAETKGNKKGDGSTGKGYGQCWECGEWGHPRRECEVFLKKNR